MTEQRRDVAESAVVERRRAEVHDSKRGSQVDRDASEGSECRPICADMREKRAREWFIEAGRGSRREQRRLTGGSCEVRSDEAVRVPVVIIAVGEIVGNLKLFVGVIAADEPVEAIVEGVALKPKLLAERLELIV